MIPSRQYLLNIAAKAEGMTARLALPVTRHISLNGTVKGKSGQPVEGATAPILYSRARKPINAMGGTTTDVNEKYRLGRVPTDPGGIVIWPEREGWRPICPPAFRA